MICSGARTTDGSRARRAATRATLLISILSAVAAPAGAQPAQSAASATRDQPNVVLIITDDLGYSDIGPYGARDIRTPNLDHLAREGVRLTDAYSNGPVCTPTRAALMSGRYQQRLGLEQVLTLGPEDLQRGLPPAGHTLPALLKRNGYSTALYGKWHLGFKPEFRPNAHGFDDFFGFLSGAVNYYTHRRRDGQPDLWENDRAVESRAYLTDEITARSVAFIKGHVRSRFFLQVAYNAPHWPFQPPDLPHDAARTELKSLLQLPTDTPAPTRQDYVRMVERLDAGVGRILAALDEHTLGPNTLVIFTNDNGGEWLSRNGPFFHRKATLWEGGIRVPLIVRWPGKVAPGRVSGQVAITMDLTATILAATGTPLPESYRPDGINLLPHLSRDAQAVPRRLFWRRLPLPTGQLAVRDGKWKLLVDGANAFLFDLEADPAERRDLSADNPALLARLRDLYEAWTADVDRVPKG